ncbi:hypothetical protein cypCar_00034510, partial [Cyprinus carpio]
LAGVFITKGDVGVGTIVGSAVFNILVIIGVCGIFARQTVVLTWWSLFRDSLYYIFSVLALILVIYDERVVWWESVLLVSMYGVYILIMKDNSPVEKMKNRLCFGMLVCFMSPADALKRHSDSKTLGKTFEVYITPAGSPQESPVVMVDELLILRPHQLSFPEAGLRVMITPHFSPRTRLTMAGRMLISENPVQPCMMQLALTLMTHQNINVCSSQRQRLLQENKKSRTSGKTFGSRGIVNGGSVESQQTPEDKEMTDGKKGAKVEAENSQPEEEDEDGDEMFKPFHFPAGYSARLKWLVSWPLAVLLYCTVPNCVLPRWHRWFMITFIASTLWIAIFSYLMVWMVTIISYTLGIPDYIMGITFLAAGTSVPDCMASLIVARQGMGDMAVSNSIGSNIFDILLGLGFPWALRTLVVDHGSAIFINNKGLVYSVILLLASVFLTVSNAFP